MKYIKQVSPSLPHAGSLPPNNVGTLSALGFVSTMLTVNVALSIYHICGNRNYVRSAPFSRTWTHRMFDVLSDIHNNAMLDPRELGMYNYQLADRIPFHDDGI